MTRNTTHITCLVRLAVLLAIAPLGGCTFVGAAVGGIADATTPSHDAPAVGQERRPEAASRTAPASTEAVFQEQALLEPEPEPESSGEMSGAATGALVGAVVDVLAIAAVVAVAASVASAMPDCYIGCSDGSSYDGSSDGW